MSSVKLTFIQENYSDIQRWQMAIDDAELLLAKSGNADEKHRLELAIKWFKIRLANGAPYPAAPETV